MNRWSAQRRPFLFFTDFEGNQGSVIPLDEVDDRTLRFQFPRANNKPSTLPALKVYPQGFLEKDPISFAVYEQAFAQVQKEINDGNSYLLNLAFPTKIQTNLSLFEIFAHTHATYSIWWKDHFTFFSPESFVQIKDGHISSYPMKGTIDASIPEAADRLLNNRKEKAEHATIVDLIRNDLSKIAKKVRVDQYRYLSKLATDQGELLQTSSKIRGELPPDYHQQLGDLFFELLPAGSISGAPKAKTLDIIKAAEAYDRGFYTGVAGLYDGKNLDSCVMIRFVEQQDDGLIFKSGGGITAQSQALEEYEEMIRKVYLPFQFNESLIECL